MSDRDVKIISRDYVYNGPIKLRIDTFSLKGKTFKKEVVEHSASVGIIPIIDNDKILLIRQFRHAVNKYLIEIPAGKIENDEKPIEAAKRELEEETGFNGELTPLTRCYLAPSYDTEYMYLFVARNISKTENIQIMDEDENITNCIVNLNDAVDYCNNGTIQDSKTISAIFLYYFALHIKKNNEYQKK